GADELDHQRVQGGCCPPDRTTPPKRTTQGGPFMSFEMSRKQYAEMYGPTTGDAIRLADTDLLAEIEYDYTVYGEEVSFGGGKVIRDGMGQNGQRPRDEGIPDTVITNVVVLDYTGIYKADVALRDGHIFGIGKAGNPLVQDG